MAPPRDTAKRTSAHPWRLVTTSGAVSISVASVVKAADWSRWMVAREVCSYADATDGDCVNMA